MKVLLLLPFLLALAGCSGCDLDERWWLDAQRLDASPSSAIDLDQESDIPAELASVIDQAREAGDGQLELSEERSDVVGRWLGARWQDLPEADERASAYVVERGDAWFEVWLSGSHNDC